MTLCWICNQAEGTTREHRSKRTDLKEVFGPSGGLYLHNNQRRNRRIQSINSTLIKFDAPMCDICNTTRTQPHDFAWEKLSHSLRTRQPPIKSGDIIRCNQIFPYHTSKCMLNVHLFFVKWLGCTLVEAGIIVRPTISTFSNAIMTGTAHSNIWLTFGRMGRGGSVLGSDLDVSSFTSGEGFDYVARFYNVDRLAVRVMLSAMRLPGDWHPRDTNRLVLVDWPSSSEAVASSRT